MQLTPEQNKRFNRVRNTLFLALLAYMGLIITAFKVFHI
jgi:hypothetical protein